MQFDDDNLIPQKAIYKWYIHCQLGDYIAPTTYERNQETPLIFLRVGSTTQIRWLFSFKGHGVSACCGSTSCGFLHLMVGNGHKYAQSRRAAWRWIEEMRQVSGQVVNYDQVTVHINCCQRRIISIIHGLVPHVYYHHEPWINQKYLILANRPSFKKHPYTKKCTREIKRWIQPFGQLKYLMM